jgi:hypothetical protein
MSPGVFHKIASNYSPKYEHMKRLLLFFVITGIMGLAYVTQAQNTMLEIPIIKTGEIVDEETQETLDISSDDAEQENDEIDALDDDDLDAGWEGQEGDANILTTGLRFQDVDIPVGATIDSAWIVLSAHEGKSAEDVAIINITGEAADNATTFDEENLITDRPATTASVEWTVEEDWIIYFPYRTPDLKEIIQEIVDRSGWAPGNALAFVLAGENQGPSNVENAREFESFENIEDPEDIDNEGIPGDGLNHPERIPKLVVYYSGGNPTAINVSGTPKKVSVYPNPVTGNEVIISLPSDKPSRISILDITGKPVKHIDAQSSSVRVPLEGMARGIYLVRTSQDNDTLLQKLIVR